MKFSVKWIDILNMVGEFASIETQVWFRGHSDSNYKLHSGLYREGDGSYDNKTYRKIERRRYLEFLHLGHLDHQEDDWNLLYLMQHHGVRTRLLDWSEAFTTALFFAYLNWDPSKTNACVWMLVPKSLNEMHSKGPRNGEGLYIHVPGTYKTKLDNLESFDDCSIALFPVRNSKRLIAQQGVFTSQATPMPLEEEGNYHLINSGNLQKIELTSDLYEDVRMFLKLSGTNQFTLFPDLDGLAKFINSRTNNPSWFI
ncbi:FRG domain-containing protein [Paenibacillus silvae]|uniref:FRG domain-containing protein n=1 Tax=Paenibacillus silvae TaxID=1325358 RepID=UPI002005CDC5|nr:FRG domain-containing protein [Paenibacillus silvae]MCK6076281.1 FRG domain-containing protein [Paenibacillus silvae]MCK6150560.1 FRG domain-containing protein [Paenibacillus silvae]MCK6268820.1 FRG domain-containing protein [Paenibacillus silvae]MCK6270413.1 FRG domain-containing protein [Paenibacillus silvae]